MKDKKDKGIIANIEYARELVSLSRNVRIAAVVSGSDADAASWEERLSVTGRHIFNADGRTLVLSLRERIGSKAREGNFLGTLLAYSLMCERAAANGIDPRKHVALFGMVFGRGERISPFTQIEGGCKPAIISSIMGLAGGKVYITALEEALMFFSPVAKYLERGGFRGVLNKWGDETEIGSMYLGGRISPRFFEEYDIIKVASVVKVTEELSRAKDWVVSNENSDFVAQISRNSLAEMTKELERYGVTVSPDGEYYAGISLGPVAVSYKFLDIAREVFAADIEKDGVILDFDPYLLAAFAMRGDKKKWSEGINADKRLRELAGPGGMVPDLFDKVCRVRGMFMKKHGRDLNMKVLNLGREIFWADLGQHDSIRDKYLAVNDSGHRGVIARKIENIKDERDISGNIIMNSEIGSGVDIRDSVVIDSVIKGPGSVISCVIRGSVLGEVSMTKAFAVDSFRTGKTVLGANSGLYRSLGSSLDELVLGEGMRQGTLLLPAGPLDLSVSETTALRDKEKNYNVPILGNGISFAEAYDKMFGVSGEEMKKRRNKVMERIKRVDNMGRSAVELQFGTSGLRDKVENMTDMECYINTRGFLAYLAQTGEFPKGCPVALGCDRRPSSPRIKRAVAMAVKDMGGEADDQGLTPSPALVLYAMRRGIPSVMITGSHIPADRNGIKFTKRSGEVLKSDERGILDSVISERKKAYSMAPEVSIFTSQGMFKEDAARAAEKLLEEEGYSGLAVNEYVGRYVNVFSGMKYIKGVKVFIYQHSAVGRDILEEVLKKIGVDTYAPADAVSVEYTDGSGKTVKEAEPLRSAAFVPVDTESVSAKTMAIFKKVMNEKKIDIGVTLDGDSDRPLFVYRVYKGNVPTDEVRYITGDILGLLTALAIEEMGTAVNAVAVPVSANDAIVDVLSKKGVEITQTKIGSPYVVAAMNGSIEKHKNKKTWCVLSWESNGGFLTGGDIGINGNALKPLPTRDALLPLIAVIALSAQKKLPVSRILEGLPPRFTHADRKKDFPVENSRAILEYLSCGDNAKARLTAVFTPKDGFANVVKINYTDGIRVYFENGEVSHLRPSGNAPEFRNYAVAATPERARQIVALGLDKIIPALAKLAKGEAARTMPLFERPSGQGTDARGLEAAIDSVRNGEPVYVLPYKEPKVWGVNGIGEYWYGAEAGEKSSTGVVGRAEAPLSGILDSAAEELIGRAVLEKFGKFLPLVKILTPKGRLSVQFHDAKNELWIMTGINKKITGKSTELIIGFESKLIKKYGKKILGKYTEALEKFGKALNALIDEMEKKGHKELLKKKGDAALAAAAVKDSSLKGLLRHYKAAEKEVDGFYNRLKVKVGDVIPVPQGTLHALGKGIEIVEPQIPGPTQSLEDGATYPVRYYFPDFPREGASKKLDIDRVSEMRSAKWEKTKPVVVNRSKKFVTERLPGGFGAKGMEVRRTKAQAGAEIGYDGKSYHMFVLISGKAAVLSGGGKYDIPCAKAGGKMMIVPASAGKFVIRTWTRAELIDTFTPVGK